jgi:hypothetical protein
VLLLLLPLCAEAGRAEAELGLATADEDAGLELLLFDDAESGRTAAAA